MSDKLITIAEARLNNELKTYIRIPFFLGMLYLGLKRDNDLYIGDTRIKLGIDPDGDYYLASSVGAGWEEDFVNLFKYREIGSNQEYTLHPFLTMCHFKAPPHKVKDLPKNYNKAYIYYRNRNIRNMLTVLVDNYMKEYNYIPFLYVIPYLYYNRDKKLKIDSSMYETHYNDYIKYNLQNNTLSTRPVNSVRSYGQILSPYELMSLYEDNLYVPHKLEHNLNTKITF